MLARPRLFPLCAIHRHKLGRGKRKTNPLFTTQCRNKRYTENGLLVE